MNRENRQAEQTELCTFHFAPGCRRRRLVEEISKSGKEDEGRSGRKVYRSIQLTSFAEHLFTAEGELENSSSEEVVLSGIGPEAHQVVL